tara:strand:+ start:8885 stop:9688 length:804 start_codon:yes stop_codon:yes gene_type:complete
MKNFTNAFDILIDKIQNKDNFAFTRFSDGELFILQNKTVILAEDHYVTGDVRGGNIYTKEEQKEFLPSEHGFFYDKLWECYLHNQEGFYKGICTGTDPHVGNENFKWMVSKHGGEHDNLTFSNLLINANYKRFIEEMVPLFVDRDIIYVANENANISKLPFEVKKHFKVGSNCMINDYDTAQEVKEYIDKNNLSDYIVLCSAASLSNVVTYECFKDNPNNTFLDIGSCLNPLLDLEGWKYTRGYLTSYWLNTNSPFGTQVDVWQSTD